MSNKTKEALGFTLIVIGVIMLYFAIAYNLTIFLGELYAINIMSVNTLVLGIMLYKTFKRKEGEK